MTWAYHSLRKNPAETFRTLYNADNVLTLDEILRDEDGTIPCTHRTVRGQVTCTIDKAVDILVCKNGILHQLL